MSESPILALTTLAKTQFIQPSRGAKACQERLEGLTAFMVLLAMFDIDTLPTMESAPANVALHHCLQVHSR
jgi:hypothetical protein